MQAITRKITPRTTRPERIDILPSPARILLAHDLVRKPGPTFRDHALRRAHLRPASIKFQAPREPVGCHDVARVGADAPPGSDTGGVDMDTLGRIIDERTFELLLVTGGALVMGLLTLIYLT